MKKIYVLILLVTLGFSSCSSFLNEDMKQQKNSGGINSVADAQSLVNQLYDSNISNFYTTGVYEGCREANGSYMMGLFDNPYKGQDPEVQNVMELKQNGSNIASWLEDAWQHCYEGISRANTCIKYLPTTPNISDSDLKNLMAQAKFFRAINYFYLVKMYGELPIITEPVESLDKSIYATRSPIADVYTLIIQDLNDALSSGGLKDLPQPLNGYRISDGTVRIVLADVYLTMSGYPLQKNMYKEAAAVSKDLINDGAYGLIPNADKSSNSAYNVMRTSDKEQEYLFVKEFDASINSSSWWPATCVSQDMVSYVKFSITNNAHKPMPLLLNAYDPINDLRMQNEQFFHWTFTHIKKDGTSETLPMETAPYRWYDESSLFGTASGGKDMTIYRFAEALLIAAEAIANTDGVTPEAAKYLAEVEARASLSQTQAQIETRLIGMSKTAFIQEVWGERLRELSLDFRCFADLQRTRMFPVTLPTDRGHVSYVPVQGAKTGFGETMDVHFLLYPIPTTEIQRNPSLTQNPGY